MSTMSQAKMKAVASPNDSGKDDDDVGALIYREIQLRKAEAAAAAAESKKKTSTASTHHRTSTRKRTPVNSQSEASLPGLKQLKRDLKRKKREYTLEDDRPGKKVAKKKYRYECSADGCTNQVQHGGVCKRHGAKHRQCSSEGCTNKVVKGGVCNRHGAKRCLCSNEVCTNQVQKGGCANIAVRGGVCRRHGAKVKLCSSDGCTNISVNGGVCIRHGAKLKRCSNEGCTKFAQNGGVCIRHGAKIKRCSSEGCTNNAKRGGVCRRHGAYRNKQDESTAFGSEYDETTITHTLPNQHASRAAIREVQQGGSSVPGEVTILCQEIVEVCCTFKQVAVRSNVPRASLHYKAKRAK